MLGKFLSPEVHAKYTGGKNAPVQTKQKENLSKYEK